jgi:hypothetical protein
MAVLIILLQPFCEVEGIGYAYICLGDMFRFQFTAMFLPEIHSYEVVPAIIDILGRLQHFFQVIAAVDIVIVKKEDVLKAQFIHGFLNISRKPFIVDPVAQHKEAGERQKADGFQYAFRVEVPEILLHLQQVFPIPF